MLKKISSILKKAIKFEISVPAIFGGASISEQDQEQKKIRKYKYLDKIINIFTKDKQYDDLLKLTKKPRRMGIIVMIIFFGVFGLWASFAPLDGAAIATGEIITKSNKKIIQHLEGGIIKEILVEEGDSVEKDQPLIYLNNINTSTQAEILKERLFALMITESRLMAEKDNSNMELDYDKNLEDIPEHKKIKIIANQTSLFKSRMNSINNQISIMNKKIDQTQNEIAALNAQLKSAEDQLTLVKEDLDGKRDLFKRNIIGKNQINVIEREYTTLIGRVSEYKSHISRAEQRIAESELEIINLKNKFHNDIVTELKEVSHSINEYKEKLSASIDVLNRAVIKAPQSGNITGLKYNTIGGIIPPGAIIMEITPNDQDMIIEAKIMPNNIESVITSRLKPENEVEIDGIRGVKAKVRLTAFSPRKVGLLNAVMTYVSADTLTDQRSGMHYYLAYVRIPKSEIEKVNQNIKLYPGMPAVVYITTESRTLLSYLLSPITSTFENSFKER
jgi:HlyD family secretion protein